MISARHITAHESGGEIFKVTRLGPDSVRVTEQGVAEGEEYTVERAIILSPDHDRLTLQSEGRGPITLYRVR